MLDRIALKITKPLVDGAARRIVRQGFNADSMTLAGFRFGMF